MGILVDGQWRDEQLPSETGKAGEGTTLIVIPPAASAPSN